MMQALVNPGDKVLMFEPFFPWYLPDVKLAGGEPLIVPLKPPAFGFDEEALRKAFQQKPRVVIVNTPHNPTGRVFSKADLDLIAKQCMEHDVIAISDEAYENITFDGHPHLRLADVKGMGVRTLTMGTSSKLLSLTGWRVGWVTGPEEYIGAIKMMHSYISFCPPTPLQVGVAHALNGLCAGSEGERENERISLLMEDNAKKLGAALGALGGVEVYPPQGGYFLVCDVGETGMDDLGFCRWLIEKVNINAVPMSIFYSDTAGPCTLVRFAICKESGTIEKAVDALGDHVDSWKSKRAVL
jgi:aspartate/methionine/tyrosine aminotransferase